MNVQSEFVETIRVCALDSPSSSSPSKRSRSGAERRQAKQDNDSKDNKSSSAKCNPAPLSQVPIAVASGLPDALYATNDVTTALQGLKSHISTRTSCGKTVLFSKTGSAIVGLYVSPDIGSAAATVMLERFEKAAKGLRLCSPVISVH